MSALFADRQSAEDHSAGADRGSAANAGRNDFPIGLGLEPAVVGSGAWKSVVGEANVVADEALVFDRHAFANEGVRADFAARATEAFFWISTKVAIFVPSPIVQP